MVTVFLSNLDYLQSLKPEDAAIAILNIGQEPCSFCPRERERRCNQKCSHGVAEWLMARCDPEDDVWKEFF